MSREKILEFVLQSSSLPTLSTVASKLISITAREETTISEITALICHDVSLSAKVLKVVNSAFYSFPNEVGSIQQAVAILGINAVRSLVLSFSFLGMERPKDAGDFDYERFWEQSLATAVAARLIFSNIKAKTDKEEVFIAGLLQNIGVLILAQAYPDRYNIILKQALTSKKNLYELEELRIGATHAYIGAKVAEHWNFPKNLSLSIQHHHDPASYDGRDAEMLKVIQATHLAGLVSRILYSPEPVVNAEKFRTRARQLLGLSGKVIDRILESVDEEVRKAADYFGLKIGETPSVHEILQKANIELSLLNMSYEQMNRELIAAKLAVEKLNTELRDKNRYLESIANLDGLTEVYNHRYFQENCSREVSRSLRGAHPLSLILADLDRFKAINDIHGHQAGDAVLKEVCRLWRGLLREYDTLARYGGEEFAILLPDSSEEQALAVAEKLRLVVMEHSFIKGAQRYSVTCSFGVASISAGSGDNATVVKNRLIEEADIALYSAKKKGRNRVEVHAPQREKWYQKIRLPAGGP